MLKIALLGTGAISDSHIKAYRAFKDVEIVALVDLFPDKAAQKAAQHGLAGKVFRNHEELLRGCDFDAASICLPPFEHAPAAVALLRAGNHVLTEQPMATCLQA